MRWCRWCGCSPPPRLCPPIDTVTLAAVGDAKVKSTSPTNNYGTETTLRARAGSPAWRSFVQFDLSSITGTVTQATLRLYATDGSPTGGSFHDVADSWTESTITYASGPPLTNLIATTGAVATDTWLELDVTATVTGNVDGVASFGFDTSSSNSVYYSSKEGSNPPELAVTFSTGPDTTSPTVTVTSPADAASDVPLDTVVTATFDEDVTGVDGSSFTLSNGGAVAGTVGYDGASRTATFTPVAPLALSTTFTASLNGAITDTATVPNALVPVVWVFTTAATVPPPSVLSPSPRWVTPRSNRPVLPRTTAPRPLCGPGPGPAHGEASCSSICPRLPAPSPKPPCGSTPPTAAPPGVRFTTWPTAGPNPRSPTRLPLSSPI